MADVKFLKDLSNRGFANEEDSKIIYVASLAGNPDKIEAEDVCVFQQSNASYLGPEEAVAKHMSDYIELRKSVFYEGKIWKGFDETCKDYANKSVEEIGTHNLRSVLICKGDGLLPDLIKNRDVPYNLRYIALEELANTRDKNNLNLFTDIALNKKEDLFFRTRVLSAIREIGVAEDVEGFFDIVKDTEESIYIREEVLKLLVDVNVKGLSELLIDVASNLNNGSDLRSFAISNIKDAKYAKKLLKIAGDNEDSSPVRLKAFDVLARLGAVECSDGLVKMALNKRMDTWYRERAITTLGSVNPKQYEEVLIKLALDGTENLKVCSFAVENLTKIKRVDVVTEIALDKDSHGYVREMAISALIDNNVKQSEEALIQIALDESEQVGVRLLAMSGLGSFRSKKAISVLSKLALNKDFDDMGRLRSIRRLAELGSEVDGENVRALVQIAFDKGEEGYFRGASIRVLEEMRTPIYREVALQIAKDKTESVNFRSELIDRVLWLTEAEELEGFLLDDSLPIDLRKTILNRIIYKKDHDYLRGLMERKDVPDVYKSIIQDEMRKERNQ